MTKYRQALKSHLRAYFGHNKEARQENPGQKSTISLNAAVLALGTNNLDVHSRDLI